jgi:hypothetical protein
MSLSGNDLLENTTENGSMSKRDKKKFEQVLRQIAASEVYLILYHRILIPRVTKSEGIPLKERPIHKPASLSR